MSCKAVGEEAGGGFVHKATEVPTKGQWQIPGDGSTSKLLAPLPSLRAAG